MELYEETEISYFRAIKIENTDKFKDFLKKVSAVEIKDCKCDMKFDERRDLTRIYVAYDDNGNINHVHANGLPGHPGEYVTYHEYEDDDDGTIRYFYSIDSSKNIKLVPMVNKLL